MNMETKEKEQTIDFEQLADKFYCKYTKSEDKSKTLSEILSYFEKKVSRILSVFIRNWCLY